MKSFPYMRGVPAAGHITLHGGYWHPGAEDNCSRCNPRHEFVPDPHRPFADIGTCCTYPKLNTIHLRHRRD